MDNFLRQMTSHATPIMWACVGVLIGLCLSAPLLHWQLPDVVANIFGGAVGAIGSVSAAFLVLKRQQAYDRARERERIMDVRRKMATIMRPMLSGFRATFQNQPANGGDYWQDINDFEKDVSECLQSLEKEQHIAAQLDGRGLELLVIFKLDLRNTMGNLAALKDKLGSQGFAFVDTPLHIELRTNVISSINGILDDLAWGVDNPDFREMKVTRK